MHLAESRSKTEKGKNAARLRVLSVYIRTKDDEGPKKYKDPAAPQLDGKPKEADTVDLGDNFFG